MREFQFSLNSVTEQCRIADFECEGPRYPSMSEDPEVQCRVVHSFKNADATIHQHQYDVLMSSELMKTEFLCDVRQAIAVSLSRIYNSDFMISSFRSF